MWCFVYLSSSASDWIRLFLFVHHASCHAIITFYKPDSSYLISDKNIITLACVVYMCEYVCIYVCPMCVCVRVCVYLCMECLSDYLGLPWVRRQRSSSSDLVHANTYLRCNVHLRVWMLTVAAWQAHGAHLGDHHPDQHHSLQADSRCMSHLQL